VSMSFEAVAPWLEDHSPIEGIAIEATTWL
jgi:hypothetical protein